MDPSHPGRLRSRDPAAFWDESRKYSEFHPKRKAHRVTSEREIYWQSAAQDAAMHDEHAFIWRAMLDTIDVDLAGQRVLDAGCNPGGFLRLLCARAGIAAGHGYDPAAGTIADARRLAGELPLTLETAETVPADWDGFDAAFSHEVLYLIHDLAAHAAAIHRALAPGASYYAVMGVHAGSPDIAEWHEDNAERLGLPPLYSLDEGEPGIRRHRLPDGRGAPEDRFRPAV
jgi:SAM-dependent methyltransferase